MGKYFLQSKTFSPLLSRHVGFREEEESELKQTKLWFRLPGDFKMVSPLVTGRQIKGVFCGLTHSFVPAIKILFSHRQTLLDCLHHCLPLKLHPLQFLLHFLAVFLTFPRFIKHILAMWHMEQRCLLSALNSVFRFSFNQQKPLCKNNFIGIPKPFNVWKCGWV